MDQIFYTPTVKPNGFKPKALMLFTSNFARIAPNTSARFALKYLFKPYSRRDYSFRTQRPPNETHAIKTIKGEICLHHFSGSSEKHVLLSHGWADTSVRFTHLIDQLTLKGFNVWVFDHIGHGKSKDDTAHLFAFIDDVKKSIQYINQQGHKLNAIIGHSMGALAVLNQDEETLRDKKIIMISAPTKFFENLFSNTKKFGVSNKMLLNALNHVSKTYQTDWQRLSPEHHILKINKNFLMIHDLSDATCSYENFKELVENTDHEFLTTENLGHLKILKDSVVLSKISHFIETQNKEQNEI